MGQHTLRLNDVLASLDDDGQEAALEKTASAPLARSQVRQELLGILGRGTEKTASDDDDREDAPVSRSRSATPSGDLEKIAEEIQATEMEALVKEAQFYGAAICDGFMARMSQFEEAAGVVDEQGSYDREKVAADIYSDIEPEAIALAEQFVKEAADKGYDVTDAEAFEKVAEDAHAQGYNDTMEKLAEDFYASGYDETMEKIAEDFYASGYDETMEKIAEDVRAMGFEEGLEKLAAELHEAGEDEAVEMLTKVAFDQGYEDAMEKIAESAFNQGYNDMHLLLEQEG